MWSVTLSNVEPSRNLLLSRRSGVVAETPPNNPLLPQVKGVTVESVITLGIVFALGCF